MEIVNILFQLLFPSFFLVLFALTNQSQRIDRKSFSWFAFLHHHRHHWPGDSFLLNSLMPFDDDDGHELSANRIERRSSASSSITSN
jgi:hypothetical protein